jgi:hypothetical protein
VNTLDISTPIDGSRNLTILVKGVLNEEMFLTPLLKGRTGKMKLTSALWLVQEKLGLVLWWDKHQIILPMESRNSIRLDRGWNSPDEWKGEILLSSFNFELGPKPKYFVIELEFDKQ